MTTSCPVSILPIEILGHIFTFLPNCHQDFPKPNTKPPSWLAVTHVCRRWRFASLSYIDLWTNIITDPVGWTEESLRRSGSAPIAIKIKLEPISSPIPNAISQALSHYPRAGRIDLEGKGIWPLLACVPVKPAPFLYSVALKERAPQFHLKHDLSFLHEDLPNLIGLLLDGIQLPWSSSGKIFKPTLVELSLSLGGVPPDHRPSDMEVREVLLSLPVLEHLFLAHAFRESTDTAQTVSDIAATPDYPYPRLSFPHLTHLTIISDSAPALSFFACSLQIPKAKAMTVAYMPHTLSGNSINNVIPHSTHFLSLGVMHRGMRDART
ncbi:hypothetical protein OF83DRAFT_1123965 [Amylostereum chailletii]|nr:hypothetical protein OF83DRAFT_1123965 [Amylostereum chailletii]